MDVSAFAKQLGKRGGQTTASRYGKKHFSEAGKKGMASRWGVSKVSGAASSRDIDKETGNENVNTGETGRKKAKA